MSYVGEYNYNELERAALSPSASTEDLKALAKWFELYGMNFWDGEGWHISGQWRLFPIYEEVETDEFEVVGYEIK